MLEGNVPTKRISPNGKGQDAGITIPYQSISNLVLVYFELREVWQPDWPDLGLIFFDILDALRIVPLVNCLADLHLTMEELRDFLDPEKGTGAHVKTLYPTSEN